MLEMHGDSDPDDRMKQDTRMVTQAIVDGRNDQTGHFKEHSVLDAEHDRKHSGFGQSVEQRNVRVIFVAQLVNVARRPQLQMIPWLEELVTFN